MLMLKTPCKTSFMDVPVNLKRLKSPSRSQIHIFVFPSYGFLKCEKGFVFLIFRDSQKNMDVY